jgi:hypothetical protein
LKIALEFLYMNPRFSSSSQGFKAYDNLVLKKESDLSPSRSFGPRLLFVTNTLWERGDTDSMERTHRLYNESDYQKRKAAGNHIKRIEKLSLYK